MSTKNASGIIECLRLRGGGISRKRGESGREEKRGKNGIVLHQRGKVSNCRASKWEIWRNGISKCKLLFVRNYKRCILEQCAMWEKQISGSALETPMQIKYFFSNWTSKYISLCKDYFWPPEASFLDQTGSGKWMEKLFLEKKKTTRQWNMTRSLFVNIAFGSNQIQVLFAFDTRFEKYFIQVSVRTCPAGGAVSVSS